MRGRERRKGSLIRGRFDPGPRFPRDSFASRDSPVFKPRTGCEIAAMIPSSCPTYLPSNDGRVEWSSTRQEQKERKKTGGEIRRMREKRNRTRRTKKEEEERERDSYKREPVSQARINSTHSSSSHRHPPTTFIHSASSSDTATLSFPP